jgi:hypothetical protein
METWQIVFIQVIGQIKNGTIDPNWVMTLFMGVTCFFLVRLLNRIEKRLDVHGKQITDLDKDVAVIKTKIDI